jgi:hypothetical protein
MRLDIVMQIKVEYGSNDDANETAEEVAEDERTGLSEWDVYSSIYQNCRCALQISAWMEADKE